MSEQVSLTEETLRRLERLCEEATSGPLISKLSTLPDCELHDVFPVRDDDDDPPEIATFRMGADAQFFCITRTAMPRLLTAYSRAAALLAAQHESLRWLVHLASGVSKGGGLPSDEEWHAAWDEAKALVDDAAVAVKRLHDMEAELRRLREERASGVLVPREVVEACQEAALVVEVECRHSARVWQQRHDSGKAAAVQMQADTLAKHRETLAAALAPKGDELNG